MDKNPEISRFGIYPLTGLSGVLSQGDPWRVNDGLCLFLDDLMSVFGHVQKQA